MKNNWTGGQYSVFRFLFGVTLFVYFIYLSFGEGVGWAKAGLSGRGMSPVTDFSPGLVTWLWIMSALALALALAVGCRDRLATILMMIVLAGLCLIGFPPLASRLDLHLAFLLVGWVLLAHALMRPAPYGSVSARNRADPGGGWRMPPGLFLASWIVLALAYFSITRYLSASWMAGDLIHQVLSGPLARDWFLRDQVLALPPVFLQMLTWVIGGLLLLFGPLCLFKLLRPWLWSLMLSVQIGIGLFLNLPELTIPMLLLHMVTFNPLWMKPVSLKGATVFFDGHCALCHGCVRFLLSEEPAGTLQFSPLQGKSFASIVGDAEQKRLGDSFVVVTADGNLLSEADAALYLLDGIGGLWRLLSRAMRLIPRRLRNGAYHVVGDRRYRIFGAKSDLCPLIPPEMKDRFLS